MAQDLNALNREAITAAKKHMGQVCWPTVLLTVTVVSVFIANLTLLATGLLPPWMATLILGVATYMSYTPLHEAVHGNIHGKNDKLRWLNDLCGYLMAPLIAVPYASHSLEHFTHHRYTNQPDKDPDYIISGIGQGPVAVVVTVFKFLWLQNTFFVSQHWHIASARKRSIYSAEIVLSLGWRIVFLAQVNVPGALWVVLIGYIMGAFLTAYWFAYRPHIPYQNSERYRNTNSLLMPAWMKPLEWLWLGQNLHSIHHLFPRVPFYRYHALHREIEPVLRAHGTPILDIFTREAVER